MRYWGAVRAGWLGAPDPADRAAARERVLELGGAGAAGLDRRLYELPEERVLQALGDLVTVAQGAGRRWQDAGTAHALAALTSALGLFVGAVGEDGSQGMSDLLQADARNLRGAAADLERDRAEAHRHFATAARSAPFRNDGFPSFLGWLGALATDPQEPADPAATVREAREALELPGRAGHLDRSVTADLVRALEARLYAPAAARSVAAADGPRRVRRIVRRWLRTHGDGAVHELWSALLPGVLALAAEPGEAAAALARAVDAAIGPRPDVTPLQEAVAEAFLHLEEHRRAVGVLERLCADRPDLPRASGLLVSAYRAAGELERAAAHLRGRLSDPPTEADENTLMTLVITLAELGSPEAEVWDARLAALRGDAGVASLLPTAGRPAAAPGPRYARFEDGTLTLDPAAAGLPPGVLRTHMTAALVEGSADGPQMLRALLAEDPEEAARVAALLGVSLQETFAVPPGGAPVPSGGTAADEAVRRGEQHFARRELAEAARCYREALDLDPEHADALMWLGDVYFVRREYATARVCFEESLAVRETPMAWRFLGDALRNTQADVERVRHCYERALALDSGYGGARQALAALPPARPAQAPTEPGRPRGAAPMSRAYWSRGWLALSGTPQTAPFEPDGPHDDPALDRVSAAGIQADMPAAFEALLRSREPCLPGLLDSLQDDEAFARWRARWLPEHFAIAATTLTVLVFQWNAKAGATERALLLARRQVDLARTLPDQWGDGRPQFAGRALILGDALSQLASVLRDLGRYSEAYTALLEAERALLTDHEERRAAGRPLVDMNNDTAGTDPRCTLYRRLAATAELRGDTAAAARHRESARQWGEHSVDSDHQQISALVEGGIDLLGRGDVESALRRLDQALPLAEQAVAWHPVKHTLAVVHHYRARALGALGLHRTALRHIAEARACNTGNADRLSADWLVTAQILGARPALGDPLGAFENALSLCGVPGQEGDPLLWRPRHRAGPPVRIEHPERAREVVDLMAPAAWAAGHRDTAVAVLELGVELADLVRAAQPGPGQRRHVQDGRADVYERLIRYHLDRGARPGTGAPDPAPPGVAGAEVRAAFTVAERLRARTLLDALSTAELRPPAAVPSALLAREAALLDERTALERADRTDWPRHHRNARELAAVWSAMTSAAPEAEEYTAVRRGAVVPPDALLGELAGERVVLASYAELGDGRTVLFTLDPRTGPAVTPVAADGAATARFIADNFGSADRVREAATDLPELVQQMLSPLVAPLAALTEPGDTVVVCPTGALHDVPFHALSPDGGSRWPTLLDRNPVAYLPSASLLGTLRRRTPHRGRGAVVLGDPGGDLPYARAEAEQVARRLGGRALLGPAATRARVLRDMAGAEVLHAACHASFRADDPLSSGLRLADGVLTGHDILRQDWHGVRLAVLSACETGLGATGRTDEVLGLSRALLFAGVRSLIMSLWRVPDDTTAAIMGDFHDLTLAGRAPAEALRTAMLAARDRPGGSRLDRWAAFCLVGEWRAPTTPAEGAVHAEHH
ncbi:CHAT domain-containing protein [Streptomyces sp. NPDC089919]|uniref:CHAT domain-containing protein n=1 Tax=Streptomyces sp. NPDC089919 TaxID=3155188 RepID=UPI003426661B